LGRACCYPEQQDERADQSHDAYERAIIDSLRRDADRLAVDSPGDTRFQRESAFDLQGLDRARDRQITAL